MNNMSFIIGEPSTNMALPERERRGECPSPLIGIFCDMYSTNFCLLSVALGPCIFAFTSKWHFLAYVGEWYPLSITECS